MLGKQDWSYVSGARHLLHGAHGADDDVTCLRFSADGNTLLSRSEDATLKVHTQFLLLVVSCTQSSSQGVARSHCPASLVWQVWDARKLKAPTIVFGDLPAARQAGVCFSPDESLIVTGEPSELACSAEPDDPASQWSLGLVCPTACTPQAGTEAQRDGTGAALYFFDRQRHELVRRVGMEASVSALLWHERLNQIFVGTGRHSAHWAAIHMSTHDSKLLAAEHVTNAAVCLWQETVNLAELRFCMILRTVSGACCCLLYERPELLTHSTSRQATCQHDEQLDAPCQKHYRLGGACCLTCVAVCRSCLW